MTDPLRGFLFCALLAAAAPAVPAPGTERVEMRVPNRAYDAAQESAGRRARFDGALGDTRPMTDAELLPALLTALDQLSKYRRPSVLPPLHRLPHAELQQRICGKPCPALAMYRPGEGIYLDDRLRPETSIFDRSVLLHELVHYVQDLNNEHADMRDCSRWYYREQEAYAIQKNFLVIVGSPVRVGYSASSSTCDDESPRLTTP
jgi:hypothetical protein